MQMESNDRRNQRGGQSWRAVLTFGIANGDIFKSSSPLIIGRIDVRLVRLEGTFDISDYTEPMLFTAWFERPVQNLSSIRGLF
jgi:hypothetical protein